MERKPLSSGVRVLTTILALSLAVSGQAATQGVAGCTETELAGEVRHGQLFEAPMGHGFHLRLTPYPKPTNPRGWTIGAFHQADLDHDLVYAATPPYRFDVIAELRFRVESCVPTG